MYNQSPLIEISTSDENLENQKNEAIKDFFIASSMTAGVMAVKTFVFDKVLKNQNVSNFFSHDLLSESFKTSTSLDWKKLFSDPNINNSLHVLLNSIRKFEEETPLRIGRTFQMSHLLIPYVTGTDVNVDISGNTIMRHKKFFTALLKNKGETELSDKHIRYGLKLREGVLYESNKDKGIGNVVAKHARLMLDKFSLPTEDPTKKSLYVNQILKQYHTLIGGGIEDAFGSHKATNIPDFFVIAGKSKGEMYQDLASSYARVTMAKGAKVWDNLIGTVVDLIPHAEDSTLHKKISKFLNINLGTGGNYRQSITESLWMIAKNQRKVIAGVVGYKLLDSAVSSMAPEDSAWSKGIFTGVATIGVNTDIMLSEVVHDRLQGYKQTQEEIAPGSTSLLAMVGLPLALGTVAGTASYFKRIIEVENLGLVKSTLLVDAKSKIIPDMIGKFLPKKIRDIEGTRWQRWGAKGVIAGLLLEAPFIPGALIGESSEEKRAIYSGEQDIAVRANRWWSTSSTSYHGNQIKYFEKHPYVKLMAEASDKSLYGDADTKRELDPFLNPFDYLRDPYRFEKLHSEDRPYPVYGMDIAAGSFIGKMYEKTIGQIIKPDVINVQELEKVIATKEGQRSEEAIKLAVERGIYDLKTITSADEASLIAEGKMLPEASAGYSPNIEALDWSWEAFKDFIGVKGWAIGLTEEAIESPLVQTTPQLARSGEATNLARSIKEANLGGLLGITEQQRRYVPTSVHTLKDRINPLKNTMPSWLPGDDDKFWLNLHRGDPFSKVEHGETRLPGAGYESLFPVLSGFDPENYPDIFKLKILSDVAQGSDAYYRVKNKIDKREEQRQLTQYEYNLLNTIRSQEQARSVKKEFQEYKTDDEMKDASLLQRAATLYSESLFHGTEKVLPSEYLTFFRPAGKFIHQRSAIEDYERTQLEGPDTAIWTKPYEHFIKPAGLAARRLVDDDFISEEIQHKRDVDRYFDNLKYLKQRELYKDAVERGDRQAAREAKTKYQKTTTGVITSDIDTDQEVLKAYISLPDHEKPYFSSFVNASKKDREHIINITPQPIGELYQTIWNRKDKLGSNQDDIGSKQRIYDEIQQDIQQEEQELIDKNKQDYKNYQRSKDNEHSSFKEYMADKAALEHVVSTGGVPDEDFSGWDPRIDMDKIKLRALSIGNEDFHKYGFWKKDIAELSRYTSVLEDDNIDEIAKKLKDEQIDKVLIQSQIEDALSKENFNLKNIIIGNKTNHKDIDLNIETLDEY